MANEERPPLTVDELLRAGRLVKSLHDRDAVLSISGIRPDILMSKNELFLELFPEGYDYEEYTDERGYFWQRYAITVDGIRIVSTRFTTPEGYVSR